MPAGAQKSRLGSRLVEDNLPLVKTLLAQMTGKAEPVKGRRPLAARMGGCAGFDELEPEDALQLGRIALAHALELYDASKGRLAGYVALWLRNELRRNGMATLHLIRAPEGKQGQRPKVGLVGLPNAESEDRAGADELGYYPSSARHEDLLPSPTSGGGDRLGVVADGVDWRDAIEDVTLEQVAEWDRTGAWPSSVERWAESMRPPVAYSIPSAPALVVLSVWDMFLARCRFAPHARAPERETWEVYARLCGESNESALPRRAFVAALGGRVRRTTVWLRGTAERGLAGLGLRSPNLA